MTKVSLKKVVVGIIYKFDEKLEGKSITKVWLKQFFGHIYICEVTNAANAATVVKKNFFLPTGWFSQIRSHITNILNIDVTKNVC